MVENGIEGSRQDISLLKLPHIGRNAGPPLPVVKKYNALQAQWVLSSLLLLPTFTASSGAAGSISNRVCSGFGGFSNALGYTADGVCEALSMFISCRSYDLRCKDPSRRFGLTLVVSPSVLPTPPTRRNFSMSMRDEGDGVVDHTCIACSIRDPCDSLSEGWIMSTVLFMSGDSINLLSVTPPKNPLFWSDMAMVVNLIWVTGFARIRCMDQRPCRSFTLK